MHKSETIQKAFSLSKKGKNVSQIARELHIPRSTVKDWIKKPGPVVQLAGDKGFKPLPVSVRIRSGSLIAKVYVYMLGVYLGDGHISKGPRTHRLRIFQDSKYLQLIQKYVKSLQVIFPNNKIYVGPWHGANCKVVIVHNKKLPEWFPQHGSGRKHKRKIKLKDWQKKLVIAHPKEIIRGLLDSDGCRFIATQGNAQYLRYQFTNMSEDIKDIFCFACDLLDISYWRKIGYKNINIQTRFSVAIIEKFYDPKS